MFVKEIELHFLPVPSPYLSGSHFESFNTRHWSQWAQTLVNTALVRLTQEYHPEGKATLFGELAVGVKGGGDALPSYDVLPGRLGIPAVTLRSHVTRLRARYREVPRAEVRRTVDRPAAVDEDLRELLRMLTAR